MNEEDFKKIVCPKCAHVETCDQTCAAGLALMKLATGVHEGYSKIKTELTELYQ